MNTLTENEIAQQDPDLYNSLLPLLRTKPLELKTYLKKVACEVAISGTQTQAHCYFVALDGNHRPRVNDFARFVAERIVDFAIPRTEITRALNEAINSRSTAPTSRLNNKAKNLFTRLPKSGEGGEVILSLLAEGFLNIPQIFTKMVLKTNQEMHVHGSDGIHAGVSNDGNLVLYWGESKLHKNMADAVRKCFCSLAPFLLDTGGSNATPERDLQLMKDGISLDDPKLIEALKHYLDPNDPMFNKMEFRGLCLVGFNSDSYPSFANAKELNQLTKDIEAAFEKYKKQISKRVAIEKLDLFRIEIFCLPFPNVEEFRLSFRKELGLDNG